MGFGFMLRRFLLLRVVDDSFSVLQWVAWVCLCLLVVPLFLAFGDVDICIEDLDLVPRAVVVGHEAETSGMAMTAAENDT